MKTKLSILVLFFSIMYSGHCQSTISKVQGCHIKLEFPKRTAKSKVKTDKQIYNAPPHCIILSYKPNLQEDLGPTDSSWSHVARGSRFIDKSDMNQAFSDATDLAVSLKIKGKDLANLKAKLNQKHSNYEKIQKEIQASHATIIHTARITGAGYNMVSDQGRTRFKSYADITLKCFDNYLSDIVSLNNHLETYVNDYAQEVVPTETGNSNNNKPFLSKGIIIIIVIGIGILIVVIVIVVRKKMKQ